MHNHKSKLPALQAGLVPLSDDLDTISHAQVHNWIWLNVPGAKSTFHEWVAKQVVGHAITLLLAQRLRSETNPEGEEESSLIQRAWNVQLKSGDMGKKITSQDVDLECLRDFERRIFDATKQAGQAGYFQWGLDAGDHQEAWDPYDSVPEDWKGWMPEDDEVWLEVS